MGKCTPFEDKAVYGKCIATVSGGKLAYLDKSIEV
jgi:dihydroorotase-like cyclic amidohydrolase